MTEMTSGEAGQLGTAKASPTKAFFVTMLTRDIALEDAILDLLDNCLDGILRTGKSISDPSKPYQGFWARITMSPEYFCIEDNCGGIPLETAKKYAFAMGRPSDAVDDTPATIGLYGIGMKRAIFKLGIDALVESYHDTGFSVEFTPEWMSSDEWNDLPINPIKEHKIESQGTIITVFKLHEEAKNAFSDEVWIEHFRSMVSRHYSLIISKGLEVTIGSENEIKDGTPAITAENFLFLQAQPDGDQTGAIEPFVYRGEIEGITVEIYAGLYRKLLTAEEEETEDSTRGSSDDAGWTVACNDRIVIWKDKTRLTGWGEATVPNYHGQFIPITGIVLLYSRDVKKLPLTTTKRGIDASSNVYSTVKDLMREATKSLTTFTNKWKNFPVERNNLYKTSKYVGIAELREKSTSDMKPLRKIEGMTKNDPVYPMPKRDKTTTRVSFTAEKVDVGVLAEYFFDTKDVKNEEVGRKAFDNALSLVRNSTQ